MTDPATTAATRVSAGPAGRIARSRLPRWGVALSVVAATMAVYGAYYGFLGVFGERGAASPSQPAGLHNDTYAGPDSGARADATPATVVALDATPARIDAAASPFPVPTDSTTGSHHPTRPRPRVRPSPAPEPKDVSGSEPASEPAGTGWIMISGAGATRARIRLDGRAEITVDDKKTALFAPGLFEVAIGDHSIVLITEEGERLGPREITVKLQHTKHSPAIWHVP